MSEPHPGLIDPENRPSRIGARPARVPGLSDAVTQAESLLQHLRHAIGTDVSTPAEILDAPTAHGLVRGLLTPATRLRVLLGTDGIRDTPALTGIGALVTPALTRAMVAPAHLRRPWVVELAERGGQVRSCGHPLPSLLMIVDDRTALLQSSDCSAAIVHVSPLLQSLVGIWQGLWTSAQPVPPTGATPGGETLPGERREAVLRYLAQGVKDESAARDLSVSVRTYRRHVAMLMEEMGASSRFQAGARAASWGLLPHPNDCPRGTE